jgi:hypothetical protein
MVSFNGTGVRLYGYADRRADGSVAATKWLALLWLPLVPLQRLTIRPSRSVRRGEAQLPFELLDTAPPRLREVAMTYFFGWIVMPLLLGWPLLLFGFAGRLGLPPARGLLHAGVTELLFVGGIVYLGVAAVALRRWDRRRFFPDA